MSKDNDSATNDCCCAADDGISQDYLHRRFAIESLREELEAVDVYDLRLQDCEDDSLAAILAHNRDEEKEHAAMLIEWLRRNDEVWAKELKTYLFTKKDIVEVEESS